MFADDNVVASARGDVVEKLIVEIVRVEGKSDAFKTTLDVRVDLPNEVLDGSGILVVLEIFKDNS